MNINKRITEAEHNEAWLIFSDREKYFSLSDEQTATVDAFIEAGHIKKETGCWPTLAEVHAKWGREEAERERKRLRSFHGPHRLTEKDMVEYEAKLLAGEEPGPLLSFMRIAVQLKQSKGICPTIDEVRAPWEAEELAHRAEQKV